MSRRRRAATGTPALLVVAERRAVRVAVRLAVLVAVSGCATSGGPGVAGRPDVAGGGAVELFVVDVGETYARYQVDRAGMLHFGGGMDAVGERVSWSGPLTEDEIERLFGLIEAGDWFEADPPSSGQPPERRYTIRIQRPAARRSFTVVGDEPTVVAVYDLLRTASARRLDGFLESLPQASDR